MTEDRPDLTTELTGAEFARWYWTKAELVTFAQAEQLPRSGTKPELAAVITAHLDGAPLPPTRRQTRRSGQLAEPLTVATVLPEGQTASQQLRAWFTEQIGPSFHFDVFMRDFVRTRAGATLGDAVDHWHATRSAEPPPTLESLEYVRFTRAWHEAHPSGTAAQCRAAWRQHRSLPVGKRPGPGA